MVFLVHHMGHAGYGFRQPLDSSGLGWVGLHTRITFHCVRLEQHRTAYQ